uniref:Nuclear receptor domain-containing protein n=1 Tax=Panagrellus redivivus TaxID=6233 RepID=A0A7E4UNQ1_PANRE
MSSDEEICLICEHPTRSLHFQVNCCRACASFFRRSIKAKLVYHCQRGTGRCDLTSRGKSKPICRYCRLKKCINMGMRIDADTEVNLASNSTSRAPVNQAVTIMPLSVDGPNFKYNPTPLLTLVKENLTKDTRSFTKRSIGFELSPLQQMCQQLTLFLNQKAINPSSIIISPDINVTDNIRFHEDFLQRLARVVTGTEDFVKIDNHQKFNVFRHFWATFLCLERAYQSITIFGQETTDMRFMITNTQGIDLGPIYGIPQDSEVCKLYQPLVDRFFAHLINPMRELKLTMFEFSFLASQLLWSLIGTFFVKTDHVRLCKTRNFRRKRLNSKNTRNSKRSFGAKFVRYAQLLHV